MNHLIKIFMIISLSGCSGSSGLNALDKCELATPQRLASANAEELYNSMAVCIRSGNNQSAIQYFTVAGVSTWYDTEVRPNEFTRKQHTALLRDVLSDINPKSLNVTWHRLRSSFTDVESHKNLCDMLDSIGEIRSRQQIFDDIAWSIATEGYANCQLKK